MCLIGLLAHLTTTCAGLQQRPKKTRSVVVPIRRVLHFSISAVKRRVPVAHGTQIETPVYLIRPLGASGIRELWSFSAKLGELS